MKIFVVDPGYSLKEAYMKYKKGDFPASVLYGIDYFEKNGVTPVFQNKTHIIKEKSKGAKKYEVLISRFRSEISLFRQIRNKSVDGIYIPLLNFGFGLCILKKYKFLNKPITACIHSIHDKNIFKKVFYKICFDGSDRLIFIAENIYEDFCDRFPEYKEKAICIELMPQAEIDGVDKKEYYYDYCMIGKTNRDYKVLYEASKILPYKGLVVGGIEALNYHSEKLECRNHSVSYKEAAFLYQHSKINIVALHNSSGIYGLTSILDSFTFNIPMIVSKTDGLSVYPLEDGTGLEVPVSEPKKLADAIKKLMTDQKLYESCKVKLHEKQKHYNTYEFSSQVCQVLKTMIERN